MDMDDKKSQPKSSYYNILLYQVLIVIVTTIMFKKPALQLNQASWSIFNLTRLGLFDIFLR